MKVKEKPPTGSGILSLVSSVYDPLGFASPFVLLTKVILQKLCCHGLKWDEVVPDEHLKNWQQWVRDLPRLEESSVNPCFKPSGFGDASSCDHHHFSDASQVGYTAVTYLRLVNESGPIMSDDVQGKRITVPRLELSPATVSVRLDKMIKRELGMTVDRTFFRTDSTSFCIWSFGKEYVLSLPRKKFWIIRANSVVRNFLANCISCRRRLAPVCSQKMADLPEERVPPDSLRSVMLGSTSLAHLW